ncbi:MULTISPECIES: AAA family ATPase [unclassified Paenibacillus]|uniref:AAA family ATPase n=1 Tax=unclassified Paenibacillus TaxID=185978 RepID=UPI002405AD68|nr:MULTISPECIES: AAA family ATPase [unclassified Paenibacillus]MDF9841522.1 putative ATPase [Paenibacillus sp. PastF-2]MDF9848111.1 putative ATPase [Paenibacillus sp. PastM-2]MDF9854680.1 putative ATPase [Paenibacillus sp. PastF-1]MDH6479712.1 putative ATPase [Paenibacillus sp. PastH-2]MDH6507385.1 putative ATPase [Paenibacillus sp. PastM-3]
MFLRRLELLLQNVPDPGRYPFSIPALKQLHTVEFKTNVTFLVGENGSGKSTLLEAIAYQCGFNTAGGGRNNTYEVDAAHSALGDHIRLSWLPKITNGFFLRAETFYHFASHLDTMPESLRYYGGQSLHKQSHGEAFLSLFNNRFGKKALYLLDEPEAALSPARQLSLMRIIKDLDKEAQFIIATHSPILLGYPDAQILNFDSQPASEIRYEDTLHYIITRQFLENRKAVLRELFSDGDE